MRRPGRRLVGILLLVAAGAVVQAVPASAEPSVTVVATRSAQADWIVRSKGVYRIYYAAGIQIVDPQNGPRETRAGVGRQRCTVKRSGSSRLVQCSIYVPLETVPEGTFQTDPLFQGATLSMRVGRYLHEVEWTGEGDPLGEPFTDTEGPDVSVEAYSFRPASAGGTLFDAKLTSGDLRRPGFLEQDVVVGASTDVYGADPDVVPRAVRVTRTIRLPAR
jgi:hypothetical protein